MTLVLTQVAALAALAGGLWSVKVKEVMVGKVVFSQSGGRTMARIYSSGQGATNAGRRTTIYGSTPAGSFTARVLRQHLDTQGCRMDAVVVHQDLGRAPSARGKALDAFMWMRNRRALTILLDKSSLTQGAAANLKRLPS